MITIITPWLNSSELCSTYERSNTGTQVIIVDNGSDSEHAEIIKAMVKRMDGVYIRNKNNHFFAKANNQGYKRAKNDVVLFLNNDTNSTPGWYKQVERDVREGGLYGQSSGMRFVCGRPVPYIEGWCIAATKATWERVGLWDETLPGLYWEDNIICWNAIRKGVTLHAKNWHVQHLSNYTSSKTDGAYEHSASNQAVFERMVYEWHS